MPDPFSLIKLFLLVCLVFIPVERVFALRPQQKRFRPGWRVDLAHVLFTGLLIQLGHAVIIVAIVGALHGLVSGGVRIAIRGQTLWLQYLEILAIADLGFYAMHRLFHAARRLWRLHAVHHSSECLDFLAAYRVHPVDQFMVRSITLVPVFLLGFSGTAVAIFAAVYHWHAMLLHSNTRFRFGWLERIVATPAFHHWHHANLGGRSCNFAGQLAIIDQMFGSYFVPETEMPKAYGIDEPVPDRYAAQLIAPFLSPPHLRESGQRPAT